LEECWIFFIKNIFVPTFGGILDVFFISI
jgi:hypothetical protein